IGAAALVGVVVGLPLAATPTALRTLGPVAASLVLPGAIALALVAVARAPRALAAAAGTAALVAELALPRRLYPSLRVTLLVLAFAALGCALGRERSPAPPRRRALLALAACALLFGGVALANLDANTRFVT